MNTVLLKVYLTETETKTTCHLCLFNIISLQLDFKINMPDDLVIVDMEGFYNFPWGRGKTYGFTTKADKNLQEIGEVKKQKQSAKAVKKPGETTGISHADQSREATITDETDQEEEITVSFDQSGELIVSRMEAGVDEAGPSGINTDKDENKYGDTAEIEDMDIQDGEDTLETDGQIKKKLSVKEALKLCPVKCGNVKVTELKSKSLSHKLKSTNVITNIVEEKQAEKEVKDSESETVDNETEELFVVKAKEFTIVSTKHSEITIPKAEVENYDLEGTASSIASRTLLSLRRAEDCSFEDIRVFNAQDNFVLKSCELKVRLRDPKDTDTSENFTKVVNQGTNSSLDIRSIMMESDSAAKGRFAKIFAEYTQTYVS